MSLLDSVYDVSFGFAVLLNKQDGPLLRADRAML